MNAPELNQAIVSAQPDKPRPHSRHMLKITPLVIGIYISIFVSGCAVGPDYEKPSIQEPAQFKENRGWLQVAPLATPSPSNWWTIYGDDMLNQLEPRVATANQSLRASFYAYQQALALTSLARSAEFPNAGASVSAISSSATGAGGSGAPATVTTDTAAISASWAPDLWGKVRRQVEANEASAEAGRENLAAAQLSLQTTLAQNYFQIRQLDSQTALAKETVSADEKFLQLTQNRYAAGVASKADVAQAQVQLANARVQVVAFSVQRAQLEHAIAVLIGEPPSNFSLVAVTGLPQAQAVPAGLPSQLLLRRPDLVAAERLVAAANAQIGVAKSAYFPSLTLAAQGGWRSSTFSNLISAPNEIWSFGPTLAATLFDGGAHSAQYSQSKSAYQQVVAQYRQLSLQALQQVEDQLAAITILGEEEKLQQQAIQAADDSLRLATNSYKAGAVSYLNVLTAQTAAYTARNAALQTGGQKLTASVALIQALGGRWGVDEPATAEAAVVQQKNESK